MIEVHCCPQLLSLVPLLLSKFVYIFLGGGGELELEIEMTVSSVSKA